MDEQPFLELPGQFEDCYVQSSDPSLEHNSCMDSQPILGLLPKQCEGYMYISVIKVDCILI